MRAFSSVWVAHGFKITYKRPARGTLRRNENAMAVERTLCIVKPDAVEKSKAGAILQRIEESGFHILALKMVRLPKTVAEGFYEIHRQRPFFGELVDFMTRSPVVVAVLERENAVGGLARLDGCDRPRKSRCGVHSQAVWVERGRERDARIRLARERSTRDRLLLSRCGGVAGRLTVRAGRGKHGRPRQGKRLTNGRRGGGASARNRASESARSGLDCSSRARMSSDSNGRNTDSSEAGAASAALEPRSNARMATAWGAARDALAAVRNLEALLRNTAVPRSTISDLLTELRSSASALRVAVSALSAPTRPHAALASTGAPE